METKYQVNRILHDEHMHVQRLLDRLGELAHRDAEGLFCRPEADARAFLGELVGVLEHGLGRHFRFEEEDLFPHLEAAGDGDLATLLREDHEILLPLAAELLDVLRQALGGGAADWQAGRRLALEFVERQSDHIAKEEMALLPAVEAALDTDEDGAISLAYQAA